MPIYEYCCQDPKCANQIEVLQKISDAPLLECDLCKKPSLQRCISAPRVRFSGGGYYETDEKPKAKQRHIATGDNHQPKADISKETPKSNSKVTAETTG